MNPAKKPCSEASFPEDMAVQSESCYLGGGVVLDTLNVSHSRRVDEPQALVEHIQQQAGTAVEPRLKGV